jgi:hypothetical protein
MNESTSKKQKQKDGFLENELENLTWVFDFLIPMVIYEN